MSVCTTCGACCASFRVDFSVCETQAKGGSVPDGLAVTVTDNVSRRLYDVQWVGRLP